MNDLRTANVPVVGKSLSIFTNECGLSHVFFLFVGQFGNGARNARWHSFCILNDLLLEAAILADVRNICQAIKSQELKMNAILIVTGIASVMMFFFFFVLPNLDRARVRDSRQVSTPVISNRSSAKTAH